MCGHAQFIKISVIVNSANVLFKMTDQNDSSDDSSSDDEDSVLSEEKESDEAAVDDPAIGVTPPPPLDQIQDSGIHRYWNFCRLRPLHLTLWFSDSTFFQKYHYYATKPTQIS